MPLDLPRVLIRTEGFDPVVVESCPELGRADLELLLDLDRATVPDASVDRCVPLPGDERRWAIGQRRGDDTMWRIVSSGQVDRLGGHPAWLWTAEQWFEPSSGRAARARAPAALPLRHLVRMMGPLGGRNRRTIKAIAAAVAAVRARTPIAVVVDQDLLTSASHPARYFVLGLLALLPPARREQLRVSIGDPNPRGGAFDLVVAAVAPPDYAAIDAAEPPDEGDDLVAYYIRNRLYDDDPEALEAAAYLFDGEDDRWGDGIAALIRDGLPGVSEVTAEMVDGDPERAVRALAARLRAGAPLDPPVMEQLVAVTLKTRDPRPWRPLARRPPLQRADAVDALLAHASTLRPGPDLVSELMSLYPRGAPLERWLPTLLSWVHDGVATEAVVDAVQETLLEWPPSTTGPTRESVWGQVVDDLVKQGRADQAARSLVSPLASAIAADGNGSMLVERWMAVPRAGRTLGDLEALVALLAVAPDGDAYVAELFSRLVPPAPSLGATAADVDDAKTVIDVWLRIRPPGDGEPDAVHAAVSASVLRDAWPRARTAGAPDPITEPVEFPPVDELGAGPNAASEVIHTAEAVWDDVTDEPDEQSPRMRLVAWATRAQQGGASSGALEVIGDVLGDARFPDGDLAAMAEILAHTADASPLWGWLTVVAAAPGAFDDATIDATVVDFCGRQLDRDTFSLALVAVERLGGGSGWEPLDHARWVVRFALAPRGKANVPLVVALLRGVRARRDAVTFMAELMRPLLELPPDHGAPQLLVDELVAAGWQGDALQEVIDAVGRMNIPLSVRRTLLALAGTPA